MHGIRYNVYFNDEAKKAVLEANYPRNIRQFRDVVNFSIDAAAPLVSDIQDKEEILTEIGLQHLPFETGRNSLIDDRSKRKDVIDEEAGRRILELSKQGYGPRKISNFLSEKDYDIEYYKVAYFLKNKKEA